MFGIKTAILKLNDQITLNRVKKICEREFRQQTETSINERPIEIAFAFKYLTQFYPKTVLDVGTGMTALPHLMRNCGFMVTAIDNIKDYWKDGMTNRHYHIVDENILRPKLKEKFDFITCISVLEHIEDPSLAVKNMFSLLNPGGHLVLTCPFQNDQYVRNVYELKDSDALGKNIPFITQSFSKKEVDQWISQNQATLIEQEYWRFTNGTHWSCGNLIIPPKKVSANESHQISCMVFQKN